jgi:thymidylate synthase (FAD)
MNIIEALKAARCGYKIKNEKEMGDATIIFDKDKKCFAKESGYSVSLFNIEEIESNVWDIIPKGIQRKMLPYRYVYNKDSHEIHFIKSSVKLISKPTKSFVYNLFSNAISTCKNSNITNKERAIKNIIKKKHLSILEHITISFEIITDRATTHEIVRHRIGMSYSQESQRYVNYRDKLTVIVPTTFLHTSMDPLMGNDLMGNAQDNDLFINPVVQAYKAYKNMLNDAYKPEDARCILPNCTATRIFITANFRALLHFFELRCSEKAAPEIRKIACDLRDQLASLYPVVFDNNNLN